MRRWVFSLVAVTVLSSAASARAQISMRPTPWPEVSAARADWYQRGEPLFYNGGEYLPSGPMTFFDGNVMVQTMTYRGVPIYENVTLETHSIVYVPVSGQLMRPYERRRDGDLAGTVGSRTPSMPVTPASAASEPAQLPFFVAPPVEIIAAPAVRSAEPVAWEVVRRPVSNDGIWLTYNGSQWLSAGRAVVHAPAGFAQIGQYAGRPVYQRMGGPQDEIYVPTVVGGMLAPFRKRS
jgi:hypothetical protein